MHNFITLGDKSHEELKKLRLSISCSCGKDSVCTAILMYEMKIPIHSIVRYTNDADWPCMEMIWDQLKQLYSDTDTKFVTLVGTPLLEQMLQKHEYYAEGRKQFGYVPCGPLNRYGTKEKVLMLEQYSNEHNLTDVVGIASDETKRKLLEYKCYPLVEFGIPETYCLRKCYDRGFYWEQMTDYGFTIRMYDYCDRLSCIYCGFCSAKQIALIIAFFPSIYKRFCEMQMRLDTPFRYWASAFNWRERLEPDIIKLQSKFPGYFEISEV